MQQSSGLQLVMVVLLAVAVPSSSQTTDQVTTELYPAASSTSDPPAGFEVSSIGVDVSSSGIEVSSTSDHGPSFNPSTTSASHPASHINTDMKTDVSISVPRTSTSLAYPVQAIQTTDHDTYVTVRDELSRDNYTTGDVSYKSTDVPDTATAAVVAGGGVPTTNQRTDVSDSDVLTTDDSSHFTGDLLLEITTTSTDVRQMTSAIPSASSTMFNYDLGCTVNNCSLVHNEQIRTENTLSFNWTLTIEPAEHQCDVTICISPMLDACQTLLTNVSSDSVTFYGLIPGTTYNATLGVSDGSVVVTEASSLGTTKLVPPNSPVVNSVTETTITVSWTDPNATYDSVILNCTGLDGATDDTVNVTKSNHSGTCTGLTSGALYNITLSTTLSNNSAPPATTDVLQNVTLPYAPRSVTATTESSDTITVEIHKPDGQVDYYLVDYNPDGTNTKNVSSSGNVTTTTMLNGLTGGTLYNISVISCIIDVCSTNATTASNTTYTNAPTNVELIDINETSLNISWDKPAGHVDKYRLQCGDDEIEVTGTTAMCVNLTAGDTYNITVCSCLDSVEPRENCTTPESITTVPYGPESIILEDRNTTALALNVTEPGLETVFDEYLVCVTDQYISSGYCPDNATIIYPKSEGLFVITDLTAGTTYYIEVYTSSNDQLSDESVNTIETTLLNPATGLNVTVREQSITSHWFAPEGHSETVTMYCEGSDNAICKSVHVSSDKETATCSGLTPGALYSVILESSLNESELAPPVNSTDVKTVVTEPQQPDNIIVETLNISAVEITVEYSYNETTGQCSKFRIKYSGNGTNTIAHERNITCTNQSVILDNLENNTLYTVSVSTLSKFDDNVSVRESNTTSNTGWTLPEKVTVPTIVSKGSRWILTNWTEVHNPEGVGLYVLHVLHNNECLQQIPLSISGGLQVILDDCNKSCAAYHNITAFDTSGYNVTALTPYYNYVIHLTAVNPGGCGQESDTSNVTTMQDIPGVVGQLSIKPNNISLKATWLSPEEPNGIISNYTITWCPLDRVAEDYPVPGADNCTTIIIDGNQTNYDIMDLDPYTIYIVSVAASTITGQGEFVEVTNETLTGVPYPAINVTASPYGYNATHVVWSVVDNAYPTGPLVGYKVTATLIKESTGLSVVSKNVEGFNNTETTVDDLDAHMNYTVCVQAYATDDNNMTFWSDVSNSCDQVQTEEAAPTAVRNISVRNDDICDKMTIFWYPPSPANGILQDYNIILVKLADDSEINEIVEHTGSQGNIQEWTASVDPNNESYSISISAKTNNPKYGPAEKIYASSGICLPTAVEPDVITNPMKKTKTTFDVELTRCSLCHNRNGNITFVGLIITENLELENKEYNYSTIDDLNMIFGSWDDYNSTVGYRTTPNNLNEMINCSISCTGSAQRWRREEASEKFTYTVGGEDDCDGYCNHKLDDSKNTRQFKVRLVLGTAGGIVVMKMSDDVYELKPNKAWIAAPVIVCLLVVVAAVAAVIIMQRRRLGPFKENRNSTRTVQYPPGTTNPAFIDEPAIERLRDNKDVTVKLKRRSTSRDTDSNFELDTNPRPPEYQNNPARPSPVKISDFEDYVAQRSSDSEMMFSEEYKLIQDLSPKHPYTHAELPNNRPKNRFVNILPFDHSRVKLQAANDDINSDYINANYMPGFNSKKEFIASQGPMKNTVDDFWRMVWEQNVPMIVMLTQLEERGRERCAKYWPSDSEPVFYGELQVRLRSESVLDSYVIRIFDIQLGDKKRSVKQMHFIRWPDFGVPENPKMLLDFVNDVRIHLPHELKGPVLVHCSAGVGRTGSFIAIDRLLQHIKNHDTLDIFSVVLEMRQYRLYMVQVEPQYILIHKCILAAIRRGLHQTSEHIYDNCVENIYENA